MGIGYEFDDGAKLEKTHQNQYQSRHEGCHGQAFEAEAGDDTIDNYYESSCGAAYLHGIAPEERNHESAYDGGYEAYGGTDSAGYAEGDGKR